MCSFGTDVCCGGYENTVVVLECHEDADRGKDKSRPQKFRWGRRLGASSKFRSKKISEERRQGAFTFKITDFRFEVPDGEHRPGVLLRNYRLPFFFKRAPTRGRRA